MFGQQMVDFVARNQRWLVWIGIPLLSILMHWNVWNLELTGPHVWRQTQTQQTIDSFADEDFCILNPRHLERGGGDGLFRMEFPLFQWLVAAFSKMGLPTFPLSRWITFAIAMAAAGAVRFLLLGLGKSPLVALSGAYLFALSPVIHYYSVSPLPDMMALALSLWGTGFALRFLKEWNWGSAMAAAVLVGTATLVKLPYMMFFALPAAGLLHGMIHRHSWRPAFFFGGMSLLALVPGMMWYGWVMPGWSNVGAVTGVFTDQLDWGELGKILHDHAFQMIPRTLMSVLGVPLLLVGIVHFWRNRKRPHPHPAQNWALVGMWVAFLLYYAYEVMLISYYHDYYMLPITLLLVIPQAQGLEFLLEQPKSWPKWALLFLLLLVPYMTYRRIHPRWRPENAEFNRDLSTFQNELRQLVPMDALVVAGPDVSHNIFLYYIDKKGWSWDKNQPFNAQKLNEWHAQGAQYLYCDDRKYDTLPEIQALMASEVGRFGSVRVYRFK